MAELVRPGEALALPSARTREVREQPELLTRHDHPVAVLAVRHVATEHHAIGELFAGALSGLVGIDAATGNAIIRATASVDPCFIALANERA